MGNFATFLGTGSSLGVPLLGCTCEVCSSNNPRNKRLRSSMWLEIEGKSIIIDTGPDFRAQCLNANIHHIDGVIFTHSHQDHVAGIDDLRPFSYRNQSTIPCLMSEPTSADLHKRFYFMFDGIRLKPVILPETKGDLHFLNIPIRYFSYYQTKMQVTGIRIGSFAYVTDIKEYGSDIIEELKGVETLVVSALRHTDSHMHLSVDEAVELIHQVCPKKAYLTHINHEIDYEKTSPCLPSFIELSYDSLKINLKL